MPDPLRDTRSDAYGAWLEQSEQRWRRFVDVQAPYRWNLRRLRLGRTLDVGCGLGRNLAHLDGNGVGVDHGARAVETARARGFEAYSTEAFPATPEARLPFDSLLFSHVLEHCDPAEAGALLDDYLPYLAPRGRLVLIAPQEAGQRSDPSHVTFFDAEALAALLRERDCEIERSYSFPLPRLFGRVFRHNENVVIGRRRH